MATGSVRTTQIMEFTPSPDGGRGLDAVFSPEEAERAAASFVPLWQLDEAPFEAGPTDRNAELLALAGVSGVALELAPPPVIGAAVPPVDAANGATDARPCGSESSEMAKATIRMEPSSTLHQPLPRRPTEPVLPSIIVDTIEAASVVVAAAEPAPVVAPPVVAAVAPAPVIAATAPPVVVTEPGGRVPSPVVVRAAAPKVRQPAPHTTPPKQRKVASSSPDEEVAAYGVPRSKTPLILGGVVASLVLVLTIYFVASGKPAQDGAAAATPVATVKVPGAPTVQGVSIPPPPSVDDTPSAPAATTTAALPPTPPPAVAATPAPAAVPPPRPVVATAPPQPAAPRPAPPPPSTPTPSHKAGKNTTPATPGGIVRNNPF